MIDFTKNYFDLFGLPVDYVLDVGELGMRYRDLQAVVHPDRYANASDQEQRLALQQATQVNEAYETLRDPLRRAIYMLRLHGVDTSQETATTRDTGFLMQQMELREELENVRNQPDPYAAVLDICNHVNKQITSLVGQMAVQFETPTADQLDAAREILRKMRFLKKLRSEAESVAAALEDEMH